MAAHQAPQSLGFSRHEHWSGLPFPPPMHETKKWKWSWSVASNSLWPHGLQPTRLLHPWDFPGKSTGVGYHCLLWLLAEQPLTEDNLWGLVSLFGSQPTLSSGPPELPYDHYRCSAGSEKVASYALICMCRYTHTEWCHCLRWMNRRIKNRASTYHCSSAVLLPQKTLLQSI